MKLFLCTPCARSMKLQELSRKDNFCRVYQTKVSRTIISVFSKTQDYSEIYVYCDTAVLEMCTKQSVRISVYFCVVVKWLHRFSDMHANADLLFFFPFSFFFHNLACKHDISQKAHECTNPINFGNNIKNNLVN